MRVTKKGIPKINIIMIFVILFILVGLLGYIHFLTRYSKDGKLLNKIPGPVSLPIIGILFVFKDRSQRGTWLTIRGITEKYYPICKGWFFHKSVVSVRHPDDLEVILSSQKASHKNYPYYYLHSWLKDGLLTNKGNTYRNRRKMLTPAFHFNMLRRYIDIINDQTNRLMKRLRSKGDEFTIDILPLYTDASLNIIVESAMGVDLDKEDEKFIKSYKEAIEVMGTYLIYRMMRPHLADWMINPFSDIRCKQKHALKILRDFTTKIIQERREYHKNSGCNLQGFKEFTDNLESENVYTAEYKQKLPMLDILLSAERDGLIDEQGIREEVDTFLLAGTDTIRMLMAFFTMLMAEHKDIQDKARTEVCSLLKESGGKIGVAELQRLPYLEQCIKETLRLYPPGSTIFRYTTDYIELKNNVIPPGVVVLCNLFDAHRDPSYWPDPEKFDPDRFLPERSRTRHPYSFVPFSAGSRNCIGQKMGMMEVKTLCVCLLYNFYLEPVDYMRDMKLVADIVLRPEDPFHTKFIRIDRD